MRQPKIEVKRASRSLSVIADLNNVHCVDCKAAGFTHIKSVDGCYSLVTENKDWNEAGDHCQSLHPDAHLLVVNDEAEQTTVAKWLYNMDGQYQCFLFIMNTFICTKVRLRFLLNA